MDVRKLIGVVLISLSIHNNAFADFIFGSKTSIKFGVSQKEAEVVYTAVDIFTKDYRAVFGGNVVKAKEGDLVAATLGTHVQVEALLDQRKLKELSSCKEGFLIQVKNNKLYVLGSDKRGTAYGILELSRLIGVSPWEWWADATIGRKKSMVLEEGFTLLKHPSVAKRGIFINDEDFGLTPWSYGTFEPSDIKGQIGPKTHARIFELLLRLRANTFWPAMHESSVAFYLTPQNKETADKYGIFIGTSHCEPMVRNANAEWKLYGKGNYDYVNNRTEVLRFWEERVKQLKQSDNIYTLGMRGVHDGRMQGAKTLKEQKDAVTKIFKDQREMIARNLNPDVAQVPQAFIPYKEVLEIYNMGLKVPDDVTLVWCDDNYGYITHFPDSLECRRKGGNGIYYHVSYWGRPHDYLWLATNHPAQLYTQMKAAYDKGAKDLWILNVGDIKPAEYLTELFLDMAWDISAIENSESGLNAHLKAWLSREFGSGHAATLQGLMNEYYRLAYIRKPEFMGNTRTEEKEPEYKVVSDLPWSERAIRERITDYIKLSDKVMSIAKVIPADKQDAWFQLVEYPVRAAAEMNKKHLYAQLARHGKSDWRFSDQAFDTIVKLTDRYNSLGNGKWKNIMTYDPRKLSVYQPVPHDTAKQEMPGNQNLLDFQNGLDYVSFTGEKPLHHGLGYQSKAVAISKGSAVSYQVASGNAAAVTVELAFAPNHPVSGKQLRCAVSADGQKEQIVDIRTEARSEAWKVNVLNNQAIRRLNVSAKNKKKILLQIRALDEAVVLDQIKVSDVTAQ